jgi:hypothetical protein
MWPLDNVASILPEFTPQGETARSPLSARLVESFAPTHGVGQHRRSLFAPGAAVITPDHVPLMAPYNHRMNERLDDRCGALPDSARSVGHAVAKVAATFWPDN